MSLFVTSDTHFNHKNIIKYANRPFETAEEMNEAIISRWNETVGKRDHVYHLGDFAFSDVKTIKEIRSRLNGTITFLKGNHDQNISHGMRDTFEGGIHDYLEINACNKKFILGHYPFAIWHKDYRGSINLFGHTHQHTITTNLPNQFHIGVDSWEFTPVPIEELAKISVPMNTFNDR